MNATAEPRAGTQSIRRAVAMLEAFTDERPLWNVSDLAEQLNLNRTTVYRLLTALESAEYVERDPATEGYHLGSGLIALGGRAQRANSVRAVALPELEALAAATSETATLEVLHGGEMVITFANRSISISNGCWSPSRSTVRLIGNRSLLFHMRRFFFR